MLNKVGASTRAKKMIPPIQTISASSITARSIHMAAQYKWRALDQFSVETLKCHPEAQRGICSCCCVRGRQTAEQIRLTLRGIGMTRERECLSSTSIKQRKR